MFRIAIKVKCSNNTMYRVTPVYTCLDPGKAKRLQVIGCFFYYYLIKIFIKDLERC